MKPNYPNENLRKGHQIRQDLRIPASFLVDVKFDSGWAIFGKLEDLSLNGAKIRLPIFLETGSPVTLKLTNHQFTIKGTCRWSFSQDWSENSYLMGISFTNLSTELYAQLRQILFSLAG